MLPNSHHQPRGDSRPRERALSEVERSSRAKLGRCLRSALPAMVMMLSALATAQNPVPQIVGPVKPSAVAPGSPAFTLSVYGANFVPGAAVNWNYQARATTFVSAHELQAQVLATDVATNTAGMISVTNPPPGGGNSSASWAQVEVHAPISTFSFEKPKTYAFGGWLVLPADFNHDATLDFVGQAGTDLVLYDGKGTGALQFQSIAGHFYDGAMGGAYGDFNGDGLLDIAYVAGANPGAPAPQANVMLGGKNGQFTLGSRIRDNPVFAYVAAGDLNGDGKLDLVLSSGRALHVYLGNGDGTFTHFKDYPYEALDPVLGDFNGDGKLDVATVSPISSTGLGVVVFYGKGDGSFSAPQTAVSLPGFALCGFQNFLQVSDFNGDGNPDLAFCTDSQIGVVLNNGNGTFQPPVFVDAGSQSQFTFAVGDLNTDGKADLLVSQYYGFNPQVVTFLGNGDGTFQSPQTIALPPVFSAELGITAGDFNSDGLLDYIFQESEGMEILVQH
jgi:hypothetical protein